MFNLLDEPWIPALSRTGKPCTLGLLDLLDQAHTLRCIDLDPLSETAVLRLIVAFATRAYNTPDTDAWGEMMSADQFDMAPVRAYAERVHDRFELLDSPAPFMQSVAETVAVIEPWEATRLLPWRRTNASTTFSVETPGSLPFDEAAIALLVHHAFDTVGIKQRDYAPGATKPTTKGTGPTKPLGLTARACATSTRAGARWS